MCWRLRGSAAPPLHSNYCFLTGCNYCEMQTLRIPAVTRQAQAALTPAARRQPCPPRLVNSRHRSRRGRAGWDALRTPAGAVCPRQLPMHGQAQPGSLPPAAPALATPKPNPAASSVPARGQAPGNSRFSQKMLRLLRAPSLPCVPMGCGRHTPSSGLPLPP